MANLSTVLVPTSSSGKIYDPLPTVIVWSNYANSQYTYSVYDTYSQPITSGYYSTDTEGWNNYSSYSRTDSSIGSSSLTTFFGQSCTMAQSEGHWIINTPLLGGTYVASNKSFNNATSYWPYYGTVISPYGIRQRVSLYANGNSLELHTFAGGALLSGLSLNATFLNNSGEPAATSYGMISYNANTKTLAYIRGNSSNNYRLHVWKNPNVDLNNASASNDTLYKFLLEARNGTNGASYYYNDFTWQTSGSTSYGESQYHMRVIMGDNDKIGVVRMTPNYATIHMTITPNPASTSLSSGPTQISSIGLTTSYGIEQGSYYGMRSMNTWDNRTIACYSPYYYYASGINMHFVDTTDPSKGYYWQYADTGWGAHPFPIGAGEIGVRYTGGNVDGGSGMYAWVHSPSGAFKNGRNPGNTASTLSNGSNIDPLVTYFAFDTGYTSTLYPWILPMSTWTKVG